MSAEVYHPGEQYFQARLGLRERMSEVGPKVIRSFMPNQHRELFAKLPLIFMGGLDAQARPWASLRMGTPGFIHSPSATELIVQARALQGDPLSAELRVGKPLGLLGLEFETRRRNRVNGVICSLDEQHIKIQVQQSFGNCPKYIQKRTLIETQASVGGAELHFQNHLPEPAKNLIQKSDSFYIASSFLGHNEKAPQAPYGVDVSHRGGKAGFIKMHPSAPILDIPDYQGNHFFNTLGNLHCHARAGLLFLDYENGDTLYLNGQTEIILEGPEVEALAGAERVLRFHLEQGKWVMNALALRWQFQEYSSHAP